MAQKGVRSEASSPKLPWVHNNPPGLRTEVRGEECRPRTVLSSLGYWQNGSWARVRGRASQPLSVQWPENPGGQRKFALF